MLKWSRLFEAECEGVVEGSKEGLAPHRDMKQQRIESLAQDTSAKLKQQLYEFCHQKHMGQKPGHQQELVIRMLTQ
ncbi:unnamed protein product, partial [Rangifer tarandus platyrhynchus]